MVSHSTRRPTAGPTKNAQGTPKQTPHIPTPVKKPTVSGQSVRKDAKSSKRSGKKKDDKEGNKRRSAEINADNVYFGDSRPTQAEGSSGTGETDAFKDFPPLDDFPSAAGGSGKELPF